jgi:Zn-dependent protease with chaperone function
MILPYLPRLLCLGLAAYFVVHVTLGIVVSLLARPAVRLAERIRPRVAARRLLALRLLPGVGAAFVVAAVCLPSYLWLEPDAPGERVSLACMAAAVAGAAMWAVSLARGLRATAASRRLVNDCERAPGDGPLLAIAGIVRPRLVVSRAVLRALPAEELAAALRHERAHWTAHDNLKRLLMFLTPGVLPFAPATRTLELGWSKFTEWAADDRAAAGSARRSCALAAALVRVARMSTHIHGSPLAFCLLGDADQLAARVDRLLRGAPPQPSPRPMLALSGILLVAGSLAVAMLQPAALYSVHKALEYLAE